MAEIREDVGHRLVLPVEAPKSESHGEEFGEGVERKSQQNTRSKRVASLDIFRGLTVAVINLQLFDFNLIDELEI